MSDVTSSEDIVLSEKKLEILCEIATESHTRIQQDFKDINPLVGLNQKMRDMGVPADVMTIDCLKSGKRIILVLHDLQPDIVNYQFSFKDQDPDDQFKQIQFVELTTEKLYGWIEGYFSVAAN